MEASGFSMWPFLRAGDRLMVRKIPPKDLKIGDIILYIKDKQSICHRLVKKVKKGEKYTFYAQGDSSNSAEPVEAGMLQGKVVGLLRKGRIKNIATGYRHFINRAIIIINPLIRGSSKAARYLVNKIRRHVR